MKPETGEWVAKAEGDFQTARREKDVEECPNYDASCFHSQQCAEKYLKARLIEDDQDFPRVHDLEAILNLLLETEPDWEAMRDGLVQLTAMAVEVRYPGMATDADDAEQAFATAEEVRETVRAALGIDQLDPPEDQIEDEVGECTANGNNTEEAGSGDEDLEQCEEQASSDQENEEV